MKRDGHHDVADVSGRSSSGFGLMELLISTVIFLVIASTLFGLLVEVQRKTSYQAEVQTILNNTRLAIQTVGRYVRQAGNDPAKCGLSGIIQLSTSELLVESDITGSAGPSNPNKGDPDGDILDSGEKIRLRYNGATRSLETITGSGAVQTVAGSISDMAFHCYNAAGNPASSGEEVRRVHVTISGESLLPDPVTQKRFGVQLHSDFEIAM